jgi:hypothetical protein
MYGSAAAGAVDGAPSKVHPAFGEAARTRVIACFHAVFSAPGARPFAFSRISR